MNLFALQKYFSIALILSISACWQAEEFSSQIFNGDRLVSSAGEAPLNVEVSELIMLDNVKTICLLGPYNETRFLDADFYPDFVKQLGDFRVPEHQQLVAVYDRKDSLIVSEFQDTWTGPIRFVPLLDGAQRFCSDIREAIAEVSAKDDHTEVRLLLRQN